MPDSAEAILKPERWLRRRGGPLYLQLHQQLESAIRSGELAAGASLPPEREIAEIADVSRVTVRKAVGTLARDGLVVQKHGSGTTVAPQTERVEQSLSRLTSFSEDMARRGLKVRSEWLERGLFVPSPEETMALGLATDSLVSRVARLRVADEVPLAIERASLRSSDLPDPGRVKVSLYALLAELGNRPVRAVQRISARSLTEAEAALLKV
ncbi:MAG: GntR family transcriptional regulator, partial [Alphaproteobacteria bacterium]